MKKTTFLILILILMPISIKAASLTGILTDPKSFERKEVQIIGEVIGEPLGQEESFWINLSSQGYNIGVFSQDKIKFRTITHWGSYAETGDLVKIEGKFYENCPLHHTSDIHLKSLTVLERGHKNRPRVSKRKVRVANLSLIICLLVSLIYFLKEKRGTRS